MTKLPGERTFGVETEFGCLVKDSATPESIVEEIKDRVFGKMKLGVLDMHARDEVFEPAQSGGFLINGGRLYIDAVGSHLEYATAECRTLDDLVANDRAGQRIIIRAIQELGLEDKVSIYNNSIDHFGGHTFGCHENYLVQMSENFFADDAPFLYPFLVTRQIFAGVGRVGGHILMEGRGQDPDKFEQNPIDYIWISHIYDVLSDDTVEFQLSQRADHIIRTIASRVRFNRAIINPKWEHFYAHEGMQRLHILFGESNQSEFAYKLKIGTTSMVLRLLEEGKLDHSVDLDHPLIALREVSRDPTYRWIVKLMDNRSISAIDIQRHYLDLCQQYRGDNPDTDWILKNWEETLDMLESDPLSLHDRLDWVAKRRIVDLYRDSEGLEWSDDALHSIDMEYHNINPNASLFHALVEDGDMATEVGELAVAESCASPPNNTRAFGRSSVVSRIIDSHSMKPYVVDWNGIMLGRLTFLEMSDPFDAYVDAADQLAI